MIRVAIYARYSDERQNERSISDQVALCARHAEARGWTVGRFFSDAAISGAALANRPGMLDAIAAAERGEFDILLCEDEDRIARNLEHLAHITNRLRYADVRLATLSCDDVQDMHVAFKGLIAADYLRNLSQKTKRGMHSNAELGLATGSRTYGYRGQEGGQVQIVAEEALIVRRIAEAYAGGDTARQIAADLNKDGVPSPRGGLWNASTISGSRQRANGILNCEIYAGQKVWNRWDMRKDPSTGKRIAKIRPREEWKVTPVPHLQIIDDGTWEKIRARKSLSQEGRPERISRSRPSILSGLLKCGCCGGSYTVYTSGKLACTARLERGDVACTNRRTPMRADIEERSLRALRDRLLAPETVRGAMRLYHQKAAALRATQAQRRAPLERRLSEIRRGVERLVDAIERGTATAVMEARISTLEAERISVQAELDQIAVEDAPIALHPNAPAAWAAMVGQLHEALAEAAGGETPAQRKLINAVRALVDRIELHPRSQDRGAPIDLVIHGRLEELLSQQERGDSADRLGGVVAGGGFTRTQPFVPVQIRDAG